MMEHRMEDTKDMDGMHQTHHHPPPPRQRPRRQLSYTEALSEGLEATKKALWHAGRQSTEESTRILSGLAPRLFGDGLIARTASREAKTTRHSPAGGRSGGRGHARRLEAATAPPPPPPTGPVSRLLQSLSPLGSLTQPLTRPVIAALDALAGSSSPALSLEEVAALLLVDQVLRAHDDDDDTHDVQDTSTSPDTSLWRGYTATVGDARRRRRPRALARAGTPSQAGNAFRKRLGAPATSARSTTPGPSVKTPSPLASPSLGGLQLDLEVSLDDLIRERNALLGEKETNQVRKTLVHAEAARVEDKIARLVRVREGYDKDLLRIHEAHLALDDEVEKLNARIAGFGREAERMARNSRNWIGSLFMPGEHDDLPKNVAFMTIRAHRDQITSLDMTHPYGLVISASEDGKTLVSDLSTGEERARLGGHAGRVRSLQVQDELCVTGGEDMTLRIWDLRHLAEGEEAQRNGDGSDAGDGDRQANGYIGNGTCHDADDLFQRRESDSADVAKDDLLPDLSGLKVSAGPVAGCRHVLEGHSGPVTSLYFEDNCLVTGAGDKTMRQWDMTTGQCVLTMDILWAMNSVAAGAGAGAGESDDLTVVSEPSPPRSLSPETPKRWRPAGRARHATPGGVGSPTPGWGVSDQGFDWSSTPERFDDVGFVGGLQFWGCALASGTIDGAIRMWDMRTGQAHRTLLGHLAAVTSLQFDEMHLVSSSLDKSVRLWDLRTGRVLETILSREPVLKAQFDTRRIWMADGGSGPTMCNRISGERLAMTTNGHEPGLDGVTSLRCIDSYCLSGGRGGVIKAWAV